MITSVIAVILGFTMEIATAEKMVTAEIMLMAVTRKRVVMVSDDAILVRMVETDDEDKGHGGGDGDGSDGGLY